MKTWKEIPTVLVTNRTCLKSVILSSLAGDGYRRLLLRALGAEMLHPSSSAVLRGLVVKVKSRFQQMRTGEESRRRRRSAGKVVEEALFGIMISPHTKVPVYKYHIVVYHVLRTHNEGSHVIFPFPRSSPTCGNIPSASKS